MRDLNPWHTHTRHPATAPLLNVRLSTHSVRTTVTLAVAALATTATTATTARERTFAGLADGPAGGEEDWGTIAEALEDWAGA